MKRPICSIFLMMILPLTAIAETTLVEKLQNALDDFLALNWHVPGSTVSLDSEQLDLHWSGASGVSSLQTKTAIVAEQPVRLASVTKTYVAAAILRLYEKGKLDLDDGIAQHLPEYLTKMLSEDGYKPESISIRHLLTHTNGLFDYGASEEYFLAFSANPNHQWTREEQVKFAVEYGDPLGYPGEFFAYSDTGYILLGEIIERCTDKALGPAVRDLLKFDALGLDTTWWEIMEQSPKKALPRARQYLAAKDATDWSGTLDLYGGGGLIANMPDLARFFEALFEGEIFDSPKTLAIMQSSVVPERGGPVFMNSNFGVTQQYCHGIRTWEFRGVTIYSHAGVWGVFGGYVPALDLAVSVNLTQFQPKPMQVDLVMTLLSVVLDHYKIDDPV